MNSTTNIHQYQLNFRYFVALTSIFSGIFQGFGDLGHWHPMVPTASAPTIGLGQRVQRQSGAGAGDGGGRCPWPGGGVECGMRIDNMTIDIE